MRVSMLGANYPAPYQMYALAPAYAQGLSGSLMDSLNSGEVQISDTKEVGKMTPEEKANFFKDILSKGADVAIAILNQKQATSTSAAEVAKLETAKTLIANGQGSALTQSPNSMNPAIPYIIIGGIALLVVGAVVLKKKRR